MAGLDAGFRAWIPPAVYSIVDRVRRGRTGLAPPVPTWAAAKAASSGYDDVTIFERVAASTRAHEDRPEHVSERDGVALADQQLPFPLLACLLRAAAAKGDSTLSVIDFGGSLGSTYRQCAPFLSCLKPITWSVIEQPHFVAGGRQSFQTGNLRFFESMSEAAALAPPDVILFSSVLQYLDHPSAVIAEALTIAPRMIIVDRTPVSALPDEQFTVQYVPADIFKARLAFRIFGDGQIDAMLSGYRRTFTFDTIDPDMRAGGLSVQFKGAVYEALSQPQAETKP